MRIRTSICALGLAVCGAASASAAPTTYNIVGGFAGGQLGTVDFDITVMADFSVPIADTATGLTIDTLSSSLLGGPFTPAGGLQYHYDGASKLSLGGANATVFGISSITSDFWIQIDAPFTNPSVDFVFDSIATMGGTFSADTDVRLSITQVGVIPLPTSSLLLITGLAGLVRARRKRIETERERT